jgi:hypothetical protein
MQSRLLFEREFKTSTLLKAFYFARMLKEDGTFEPRDLIFQPAKGNKHGHNPL